MCYMYCDMAAIVERGYNTAGFKVLSKDGQELDDEFLKRYKCVICNYLLRGASQLLCGDRICKSCFPSKKFSCPMCQEEIDPSKPQQFFNDRSCQKDIRELQVVCKCEQKLSLEDFEEHCDICPELAAVKPKGADPQTVEAVRRCEKEIKGLKSEVSESKKQSNKALKKVETLEREMRQIRALLEGRESGSGASLKPRLSDESDVRQQVRQLLEKYTQLNEVVTQLVADVEQHKGTLTQMNTTLNHISDTIPQYENMFEELNLKIEILEVKTTAGLYVWKVNDLSRRQREARIGRTVSLYSPPFYSSPHGYRLCLRAYLNGDGTGKGTHISLFIVLMKSEYDDLLSWPFRHTVTMRLINQDHPITGDNSITHKFAPNPESGSFQKPIDTFNVASGFPQFASQTVLSDPAFTRNDTIYFQVKLDPPNPPTPTGPDQAAM